MNNESLFEQVIRILKQHPEGSHMTHRHREDALFKAVRAIVDKFKLEKLDNLKAKHIDYIVELWKSTDNGKGNIHNDLGHLRWLLDKLNKSVLLDPSNKALGIAPRDRESRQGKFVSDETFDAFLKKLDDPKARALLLMGRFFGLRFEEASLFRPHKDVRGRQLWTNRGAKGGRLRYIWMTELIQEQVLQFVKKLVPFQGACLIPPEMTYNQWRGRMYEQLREAGISRKADVLFHDLRRTFIESDHSRLIQKGLPFDEASKIVAKKVGHHRVDILKAYMSLGGSHEDSAA